MEKWIYAFLNELVVLGKLASSDQGELSATLWKIDHTYDTWKAKIKRTSTIEWPRHFQQAFSYSMQVQRTDQQRKEQEYKKKKLQYSNHSSLHGAF